MKFYSVTLRMDVLGQQCINRWDYSVPSPGAGSSAVELLRLMGLINDGVTPPPLADTIFSQLVGLVSEDVQFVEVEGRELYTPVDFYVAAYSPGLNGASAGAIASITDAFGLFSNRVRTDIKRGFKRFPGLVAGAYAGGSQVENTFLVSLGVVAERMSSPLEGDTATYAPSVFQFEPYVTPSGRTAYRKYADPAVQAAHVAADVEWAAYDTVRTQVSRQIGRGS